jgi:hypothetical protein
MINNSLRPAVPRRPSSVHTRRSVSAAGVKAARRPRARRLAVTAVLVLAGALIAPGTARAAPVFPEVIMADGNLHTYCLTAGFTTSPNLAHNAMNVLGATDFTVSQDASCLAGTDVWWIQMDLPGRIRGQEECMDVVNGRCSTADVRIDFAQIDQGDNDAQDREKTAVHELGHSVGLGHHADPPNAQHECVMRSGDILDFPDGLNIKWRRYHQEDITNINAAY